MKYELLVQERKDNVKIPRAGHLFAHARGVFYIIWKFLRLRPPFSHKKTGCNKSILEFIPVLIVHEDVQEESPPLLDFQAGPIPIKPHQTLFLLHEQQSNH